MSTSKKISSNLAAVRCDALSLQIQFESMQYAYERPRCVARSDDRHNIVTQILAVNARKPRRKKECHPRISIFLKFLQRHWGKKGPEIFEVSQIGLPSFVETHKENVVVCGWVNHPERPLYWTLKCARDGYADGADRKINIFTAQAACVSTVQVRCKMPMN